MAVKSSKLWGLRFFMKRTVAITSEAATIMVVSKIIESAFARRIDVSVWMVIVQRFTATSIDWKLAL